MIQHHRHLTDLSVAMLILCFFFSQPLEKSVQYELILLRNNNINAGVICLLNKLRSFAGPSTSMKLHIFIGWEPNKCY